MRLTMRVDATPEIGAGHAMRCATLAEAWLASGLGDVDVRGRVTIPFVVERLRACDIPHVDAELNGDGYDVVLVDSYAPGVRAELSRARAALRVAVDDVGDWVPTNGEADIVWNPNPHGSQAMYPGYEGVVLSGPQHVPIREPLPAWRRASADGVGVALGGSQLAAPVRDALAAALDGAMFGPIAVAGEWGPEAWRRVAPSNPWSELARCARVVVGAGTSAWEAAAIGIPAAVVCIAENQRPSLEWIRAAGGATVDLTRVAPESAATAVRAALASAAPLPWMTSGARLVASELSARAALRGSHAPQPTTVTLRPAAPTDAYALWLWANDVETRTASFGRETIPWSSHVAWLARCLASAEHAVFIGLTAAGQPCGSIRFDSSNGWRTARLSYVVAPESRGHGYSTPLIDAGVAAVRAAHPAVAIFAEVSAPNERSLKAFRRARGWSAAEAAPDDRATFWNR